MATCFFHNFSIDSLKALRQQRRLLRHPDEKHARIAQRDFLLSPSSAKRRHLRCTTLQEAGGIRGVLLASSAARRTTDHLSNEMIIGSDATRLSLPVQASL